MDKKLVEAVEFFKKEKGFQRLFLLLIKKYKGLGRIGGSVKITQLKSYEQDALSSFLGRDLYRQTSVTISFQKFIEALSKTKFEGVDPIKLLEGYMGQKLLTRMEEEKEYHQKKDGFFKELLQEYPHPYCQLWLQQIIHKKRGTRGVHCSYDINPAVLKKQLENTLQGIGQLPEKDYERLPIFAQRITKDPHGFDMNTDQGRLFLSALQCIRESREVDFECIANPSSEELNEIMQSFFLIRDDIQNFVTCTGMMALDIEKEKPLALWVSAFQDKNVLNIPLRELTKVGRCFPGSHYQSIFVVENSGVFSAILDGIEKERDYLPPIICTHGQCKLATLILLDKLAQNPVEIYYSGDFDPEGLQIAQKLFERYPKKLKLWKYGVEDYKKSISHVELNQSRLNKLDSITLSEFTPLKEEIRKTGKAGYQEELVAEMIQDIIHADSSR